MTDVPHLGPGSQDKHLNKKQKGEDNAHNSPKKKVLRTQEWRLYGVHRHSRVEQGLDGKDLASAYVLCPVEWQSSYFRVGRS
jgi:hypothetical protein